MKTLNRAAVQKFPRAPSAVPPFHYSSSKFSVRNVDPLAGRSWQIVTRNQPPRPASSVRWAEKRRQRFAVERHSLRDDLYLADLLRESEWSNDISKADLKAERLLAEGFCLFGNAVLHGLLDFTLQFFDNKAVGPTS